jgi:hypothetical protein
VNNQEDIINKSVANIWHGRGKKIPVKKYMRLSTAEEIQENNHRSAKVISFDRVGENF